MHNSIIIIIVIIIIIIIILVAIKPELRVVDND